MPLSSFEWREASDVQSVASLYILKYNVNVLTCQYLNAIFIEDESGKFIVLTYQHAEARKVGSEQVVKSSEMPKYVDLSPYWTDPKKPTIQEAKEKTGLDKRTLSAARKGQLERGQFETLFKLRDLASELAGKPLMLEEIFKE